MPNYDFTAEATLAEDKDIEHFDERDSAAQQSPGSVGSTGFCRSRNDSHLAKGLSELGQKESEFRRLGADQDIYELKEKCLKAQRSGKLEKFEDPAFSAQDSSLFCRNKPKHFTKDFVWSRPGEILRDRRIKKLPKFFVDGSTRFDVNQRQIGDCWFLAALSSLTMHPKLFFKVVPDDNGSFEAGYAGIFHFRFWQSGKWVDVVIDDRLPMYDGRLIGVTSTEANEYWSALLEKAYAKLYGSYEALRGGLGSEALRDLTGGVVETYYRSAFPPELFRILLNAYKKNSLMTCGLSHPHDALPKAAEDFHKHMRDEGMMTNHEYSITCVTYVRTKMDKNTDISLIRIRNPQGNAVEWKGMERTVA